MQKSIEMTGATCDLAIEKALETLGLDRDSVSVEVLDIGKKGFLGLGRTEAKVRVTYEAPDEPVVKAAPKHEAPKAEPKYEAPKAAPVQKQEEKRPAQTRPSFEGIDPADPRLTTPHLVKAAPAKTAEEKAAEKAAPKAEHERTERPRRERAPREDRAPRAPRPSVPHEDKPIVPVTPEAMEKVTAEAVRFIEGLLKEMGVEGTVTVAEQVYADQLRLEISGPDMGPVIGRRGDTLDAIQYLTSLVMGKVTDEHVRLSVDTEGYRVKRAESLERLARKMAGKAVSYHKPITLEPMNPYERRIIHAALQDYRGVTTYSTGSEPGRRVVIAPEGGRRPSRPRNHNR